LKFFNDSSEAMKFLTVFVLAILLFAGGHQAWAAGSETLSDEEILRLGERMYREGILPSGEPMQAYVSGDIPVDGTSFTCVSCHLRSGLGSIEGEVVTPPTNGRILYQPRTPYMKGYEFVPYYSNYAKYLPARPAYTDETLAALIASGVDPSGRSVLKVMPRYEIEDADMAILIAYLKQLSDQPSPGVTKDEIKFATVIVEGTDPEAVESMLLGIQFGIDRKNALAAASEGNDRMARMAYNMLGPDLMGKHFSLAKWILKGPPETWRAQLEDYYAGEPVFALLGGISEGEWAPVHAFCEDHELPDLFPVVDFPVLSDSDWYTLYFSRGVRQQGEASASYLNSIKELFDDRAVVQVFRDNRRGIALADGFNTFWEEAGHPAAAQIALPGDAPLDPDWLRAVVAEKKPSVLLVWDDAGALPALEQLAASGTDPRLMIASGTWLGDDFRTIREPLRKRLYLTWPYRLPREEQRFDSLARKVYSGKRSSDYQPVVVKKSYDADQVFSKALTEMRSEYYRDFLLDMIGMMEDAYLPLYERLTFGPGQRYASKGCFVVQLGEGENPQLERRSEWLIK